MNKYVTSCADGVFSLLMPLCPLRRYLTRLNGELQAQPGAAKNIASLDNLVLVNFEQDRKQQFLPTLEANGADLRIIP